jgi:protein phosphatase
MTQLRSAALSNIGHIRQENEDRFLNDAALRVYGVADGIGGLPGGAEAAQKTVDGILAQLQKSEKNGEPDLVALVQAVHQEVRTLGLSLSPAMGIGSTLTFGQVAGNTLRIAHVGDSRCYGWHNNAFSQVTEDHSVENEARLRRARGEIIYYEQSSRHALTRCIGQPGLPQVDVITRQLVAGDRYLFCTDGVSRLVRDAELGQLISKPLSPEEILHEIIALALRRGGLDNATAVLLFVDEA